jgi:hypothetical protein
LGRAASYYGYDAGANNFIVGVYPWAFQNVIGGVTDSAGFWNDVSEFFTGRERVAVVQDQGRPLTSVAHEMGHLSGRKHAGLGTPPVESWPPDGFGEIQGVGIDRRDGSVVFKGLGSRSNFDQIFDFMSYAHPDWQAGIGDKAFWISVKGWTEALDWFWLVLLLTSSDKTTTSDQQMAIDLNSNMSPTTSSELGINPHKKQDTHSADMEIERQHFKEIQSRGRLKSLVAVQVILDESGSAHEIAVYPLENQIAFFAPPTSPYQMVIRDGAGKVLAAAAPRQIFSSDPVNIADATHAEDGKACILEAKLPVPSYSAAMKLELYHDGKVIASHSRPRVPPRIAGFDVQIILESTGSPSTYDIVWSQSIGASQPPQHLATIDLSLPPILLSETNPNKWKTIYCGSAPSTITTSTIKLPHTFFPFNPCARLRLRLSDSFNEVAIISPEFACPGSPPHLRIVHPAGGAEVMPGAHVYLRGEAFDDCGRRIGGGREREKVCWTVDGVVVGEKELSSWVTDPETCEGRSAVTVVFSAVDYLGRESRSEIFLKVVSSRQLRDQSLGETVDC